MEIKLTKEESEEFFYRALCNLSGYLSGYGLEISFDENDYKEAKERALTTRDLSSPCYEDVLMNILEMGKPLKIIDHEGDGEYNREIFLKDVYERVSKAPFKILLDMYNEDDDVVTADCIIQSVFFDGEIIFG